MEITFGEYFEYTHHQALVPSNVTDGREAAVHPVVIAGGGPTGLALALGLANFGVRSVVLEADATVCSGSRAGAFTRRTLEILERFGVIDEVMRTGLRWSTGRTYFGAEEVFAFHMPDDADQKYPPAISHLQNYIEHCMVQEAERRKDLIEIRWQSRVAGVAQEGGGVRIDVETPAGHYALRSAWLVACDGGRSQVREALGLRMQGRRHEGRYVIIDIRIDTEGLPPGRRCWFDPPSKPGTTLLMYKKPGGMLRFDYQLADGDDEVQAMQPERVFAQVNEHLKMLGIHRPWEPVWMSLYRASALTLERYLHGRVLFAGDAAHLVPIFGVRGMNSAIDDAHNLAWKLALTVQGKAGPGLLESYSTERVYAARENHRYANKSAEFMAPPSAPFKLMRDAVLSLSKAHPWVTSLMNPRQHAAIPLRSSPLNAWPAGGGAFEAGPEPGDILLECPVAIDGRAGFLTDVLGPHFTALHFSETGEMPAPVADAIARMAERVPLKGFGIARAPAVAGALGDAKGRAFPLYGARPGTLYLVRPDGHVLARWLQADPLELEAVLDTVLTPQAEECHV